MGKHERMVPNLLPLPCENNRGGETHCSRRVVPAPSRNTGLGTEILSPANPWLQEHQGQRHLSPDIQPGSAGDRREYYTLEQG